MTQVDAVLLDLGGVFVMPRHDVIGRIAADHGGEPSEESLVRGHYLGVAAAEEHGGFSWADYRRVLLQAAGVPPARLASADTKLAALLAQPAQESWCHLLPGAIAGLRALADTGVALAVVSNCDGTAEALLTELGVCQVGKGAGVSVRAIIDSHLVGAAKPDPAIFQFALDALGTTADRVAHVGDTCSSDVAGAFAAGIRPLHLDPIGWCHDERHEHVASVGAIANALER